MSLSTTRLLLFLISPLAFFVTQPPAHAQYDVDLVFFDGNINGLSDITIPSTIVELRVEVNLSGSTIKSGEVTVSLPDEFTYTGFWRRGTGDVGDVVIADKTAVITLVDDGFGSQSNFHVWIAVQTMSWDDLPPSAKFTTISVAGTILNSLSENVEIEYGWQTVLAYSLAKMSTSKGNSTVEPDEEFTINVEVEAFPHYEMVYSRISVNVPYQTDLVPGSVTGLPGHIENGTGQVFAEYPTGSTRSFNFSFRVKVRGQFDIDFFGIRDFPLAIPSTSFRIRTPYTGNNNDSTRTFHSRSFSARFADIAPIPLDLPPIEIIVNSTADRGRKAGAVGCETGQTIANGDPECTLRSAIEAINDGIGSTITFNIPGSGIPTIPLTKALPVITKPVTIDATTQSAKWVEVKGGGNNFIGLILGGGSSEVRGLIMSGFVGDNAACLVIAGGNDNTIAGNYFGTNASGISDETTTISVTLASQNNTLGGSANEDQNIIGGETAVLINGSTNTIAGNRIGIGKNGALLDETNTGIFIIDGNGNKIGGSADEGNEIAAKTIDIFYNQSGTVSNLTISNNRIGLDAAGQNSHSESHIGIALLTAADKPLTNLVISENKIAGGSPAIWLAGGGVTGAEITENTLGLAFDSTTQLPSGVSTVNNDYGIRLDNAPSTTLSENTVVGFEYNIVISGQNQYAIAGDQVQFSNAINPKTPEPSGATGGNITLENNTIGLASNQKPAGADHEIGVTVFGKATNVTIRNNTIAGHDDDEIWLKDGSGHTVVGNRIGTADGTNHGSQDGILVTDANQVTIGASGLEGRNIISRHSGNGIEISGAASGTTILNNYIGTNVGATQAWPNNNGIEITSNGDDSSTATVIRDNVIAGNTSAGIAIDISNTVTLTDNYIGRSLNGNQLPNAIGVNIIDGTVTLTRNTIAYNTTRGIAIEGTKPVFVNEGSIYSNGNNMASDGIYYKNGAPLTPPNGLVIIRSVGTNSNGKIDVWIGLPSRSNGGSSTLQIYANNEEEDDDPQGRVFMLDEVIDTSKPFTKQIELDPNSFFLSAKSLTGTLTKDGATSSFSTSNRYFPVIGAGIDFIEFPPEQEGLGSGFIGILLGPSEIFRLEASPLPNGPWSENTEGESETITKPIEQLGIELEFEVWAVPLNEDEGQYWRASLDWEKLLGEPVN